MERDEAICCWAREHGALGDGLLFQWLGTKAGDCAIVPVPGDEQVKRYIDGGRLMAYRFAMQMLLPVSDAVDDVNARNLKMQREWAKWVIEQQKAGHYPDFGDGCSDYMLEVSESGPMMAGMVGDHLGKYQFFATLYYREAYEYGD